MKRFVATLVIVSLLTLGITPTLSAQMTDVDSAAAKEQVVASTEAEQVTTEQDVEQIRKGIIAFVGFFTLCLVLSAINPSDGTNEH
ncbi:hypothetical protein ACFL2U_03995 [Patescibacteria group bacterium]